MINPIRNLLLFTLVISVGVRAGQPSAADPAPASSAPLAGPKVEDEKNSDGAIERGFEGAMKPLDVRPEVAALESLSLSPEERSKVDAVLVERRALMERLIRENLDLLVKAQSVRATGDEGAQRNLMQEFGRAFKPLSEKGTLASQLSAALPEAQREAFEHANTALWKALIEADADADMGNAPAGARMRVGLRVLGEEVKSVYEGIVADGNAQIERLSTELQLSPEQQGKIQAILVEHAQKTKLNPNGLQRAGLFLRLMRELTPEQRRKAWDVFRKG